MNILLIGPRASGKSTIGHLLAGTVSWPFVDLDQGVLDCFEEPTVTEIWASHGEPAWRAMEVEMLETTLGERRQVVALGGGVPMIEPARHRIDIARRAGEALVIYLRCDAAELKRRLVGEVGDRPGLRGDDPISEVDFVLAEREPIYLALADRTCDVSGRSAEAAARELAEWLSERLG